MDHIDELFTRRVDKILPSKAGLIDTIKQKGRIKLYQGFDPTGSRLHLGHTVGLRKLMDFANAGHEVIILFGTGTVLVGDPSLRDTSRKVITQAEIDNNIKNWRQQVAPIVDFSKVSLLQNGEWLTKLNLKDLIEIASNISAVQLFKRESFTRRIANGNTVWYHETMYPLLQGYDSVKMDVDLEIGGTDQEFNMLIGRELQQKMNHREKFVLTTPMILGTDGNTMSKTSGNCIFLDDTPNDMYAKILSLRDELIVSYANLVTDLSLDEIQTMETGLTNHTLNPLEAKKRLAAVIISQFYDADTAQQAGEYFKTTFQQKDMDSSAPELRLPSASTTLIDILKKANLGISNAQIKRVIEEGGVEYNQIKITDINADITPKTGDSLKFGKHTFRRIVI